MIRLVTMVGDSSASVGMTGEGGVMTGVGYQDDMRGDFYRRDDYYEFAKVLEE